MTENQVAIFEVNKKKRISLDWEKLEVTGVWDRESTVYEIISYTLVPRDFCLCERRVEKIFFTVFTYIVNRRALVPNTHFIADISLCISSPVYRKEYKTKRKLQKMFCELQYSRHIRC